MTHLRYFVSLTRAISRLRPDIEQTWLINHNTKKYNSLGHPHHVSILNLLIAGLNVTLSDDRTCAYDIVFSVEGYEAHDIVASTHFALQHGFDYRLSAHTCKSDVIHLMVANDYCEDLLTLFPDKKAIASPFPISCWNMSWSRPSRPLQACIFYPEDGHHQLVTAVVEGLQSQGVTVSIKQRAKNQNIPDTLRSICDVYYDSSWWPSESIVLPLASDVTIGFGTSAYTDLIPMGVNFIDVPIPEYSQVYFKPKQQNMRVMSPTVTAEQIVSEAVKCRRGLVTINQSEIDVFVNSLLEMH